MRRTPLPPFGLQGGVADQRCTTCGLTLRLLPALMFEVIDQSSSTALYHTIGGTEGLDSGRLKRRQVVRRDTTTVKCQPEQH